MLSNGIEKTASFQQKGFSLEIGSWHATYENFPAARSYENKKVNAARPYQYFHCYSFIKDTSLSKFIVR